MATETDRKMEIRKEGREKKQGTGRGNREMQRDFFFFLTKSKQTGGGIGKVLASASTLLTAISKSQQNLIHQTALRQMESKQLMDSPQKHHRCEHSFTTRFISIHESCHESRRTKPILCLDRDEEDLC